VAGKWTGKEKSRRGETGRYVPNSHMKFLSQLLRISPGRFELFLDLLYVAILANFAENLAEHVSGDNLVKYIVSIHLRKNLG
jgi:low temperature requirement protein LtrA